jgi:Skp family chaperone for outer membrane proteins
MALGRQPARGALFALSGGRDAKNSLESAGMTPAESDAVIGVADSAVEFGVALPIQRLESAFKALAEQQEAAAKALAEKQEAAAKAVEEKQESAAKALAEKQESAEKALGEKLQSVITALAEKQKSEAKALAEKQQYSLNALLVFIGLLLLITFPSSPYYNFLLSLVKK